MGTLCSAMRDRGKSEAQEVGVAKTIRIAAVEGVAVPAARMARKEAAKKAMHEASKKVAAEVEHQVAKLVLAEIFIAVDIALAELTLIGITVPAYRRAIPGVIYVALLRKLHAAESAFRAGAANKPMKRNPWHPGWQGNAGGGGDMLVRKPGRHKCPEGGRAARPLERQTILRTQHHAPGPIRNFGSGGERFLSNS